jgi:predicted restriction endonuclease
VTGVDDSNYLIASHIKPWGDSSNSERLSANNGLMLAPHVDHLFDHGYISFSDVGDLLISPQCTAGILATWGVLPTINVGPFRNAQREYLAYHRANVLKR